MCMLTERGTTMTLAALLKESSFSSVGRRSSSNKADCCRSSVGREAGIGCPASGEGELVGGRPSGSKIVQGVSSVLSGL